jgi:hypothetical protein
MAKITTQQEAYDAAAAVNDAARAEYLAIQNRGLEKSRRRHELARVYVDARAKMGAIRDELAQSRQEGSAAVEAELFGIPGPKPASAADRAALAANMRDALGRASDCDTPEELARVLGQWTVVGDEIGQRACAAVAFQRMGNPLDTQGWSTVIDEYAESHPDDAARISELANPFVDTWTAGMGLQMALAVAKPIDLTTVPDWSMDLLAKGTDG